MRIPESIDRILELSEAIFRHYFWARSTPAKSLDGQILAPP